MGHKTEDIGIETAIMTSDNHVLSGSITGELWCWDLVSGSVVQRVLHTQRKALHSLCVHPRKDVVLTASTNTIKLWGTKDLEITNNTET